MQSRLLLGSISAALLFCACPNPGDGNTGGGAQGGGSAGSAAGGTGVGGGSGGSGGATGGGSDVTPYGFPLTTPMLFGYAIVDAFPGTFLSGAMDMEWPKGSSQPFVLQAGGHIVRLHGDGTRDLCLNFETQVAHREEAGALGMALHPKFEDPVAPVPYVYVWYNLEGTTHHQRLSRWTWDPVRKIFDPASELVMVEQTEYSLEHNGARVRFGPDNFLYFPNGDDTRPDETTQRLDAGLFSGLFRIDVDMKGGTVSHAPPRQPFEAVTQGYFIPNDNPFVGVPNANEEYFALGFRNPYAFSFDRANGQIWLGDVGDTWREELNPITAAGNYQWPVYEGDIQRRMGQSLTIGTPHAPAYTYSHASLGDLSAIMMGVVYRGTALPELAGKVIYSDWPAGRIWAFDPATGKRQSLYEWNSPMTSPVGFGQDAAGEVYVISWSTIYRLARATAPHGVPAKLSQTNLFRDLSSLTPSSLVHPYSIRSPLWSDGASKHRFVYVPAGQTAAAEADGGMDLPPGSMLVKQFDLPDSAQPTGGRTKRLETRVLVVGNQDTYGVTYRWNHDGTDADLLLEAADEQIDDLVPAESRTWHFPSSGECWSCHREENRVLGFRSYQLNYEATAGTNQLAALATLGMLDPTSVAHAPAPLASPTDTTATAEARASAYFAANCAHCHHPGAAYLGGVSWNANPGVAPADRGLLNEYHHNSPMAVGLGLPFGVLVKPGDPMASLLRRRIASVDPDLRMPPVGRTKVDPVALEVIDAWISSLPH
ncbi:MAG: PQQ-dependent sugar dehydrogenase [Archangiaceae bacterium]|nr:PQQ-dependent sugar dehydrogenase [Archangiaceae bacterium]